MKWIVVAVALAVSAPVNAQTAAEPDYERLFKALFAHMAVTYVCRDALGGIAHYQAARGGAVGTITRVLGQAEAVRVVAKMDTKFRNDPRAKNPAVNLDQCLVRVNDGLFEIEKAKVAAGLAR